MAKIDCDVDFKGYFKDKEFVDISTESWREYVFPKGETVVISEPQWLNISSSGGHRIIDSNGHSHYIPCKWIHLHWQVKPHEFYFVR